MKCLFISSRKIWPSTSGREATIADRIESLVKHGIDFDVFYYGFDNESKSSIVHEFSGVKVSNGTKLINVVKNVFKFKTPFQFSLFYSKENNRRLEKVLSENHYDMIFVDMIRLAPLYKLLKKKTSGSVLVLDLDDLISARYKHADKNILGYASDNNKTLGKLLKVPGLAKLIVHTEGRRISRGEKYYSGKYDKNVLVSPLETKKFKEKYPDIGQKTDFLPVFVKDEYIARNSKVYRSSPDSPIRLGFAGMLKTPANRKSLENIAEYIIPNIKVAFEFKVIGKYDEEFKNEFNNTGMIFTGFVDDFRKALQELDLLVCPIAFGTGIKTKIIEAMSCGVPVITNSVGIEGMEIEKGHDVLFSDDLKKAGDIINEYSKKPDELKKIGENGFTFVKENHSESEFLKRFCAIFDILIWDEQ